MLSIPFLNIGSQRSSKRPLKMLLTECLSRDQLLKSLKLHNNNLSLRMKIEETSLQDLHTKVETLVVNTRFILLKLFCHFRNSVVVI
jgi:hypothetical protein